MFAQAVTVKRDALIVLLKNNLKTRYFTAFLLFYYNSSVLPLLQEFQKSRAGPGATMPDQWAREQGHYFVELREKYLRKEASIQVSTVAQKCHGNFNLLTAISICSRQFQFAHGSFNLLTAVSISLTAFFNLLTAVSISLTAVSTSLMMKLQWISANIGHAGCQVLWEILKYVAKLLITFVT